MLNWTVCLTASVVGIIAIISCKTEQKIPEYGQMSQFAALPGDVVYPEGIAVDEQGHFFVASFITGEIYAIDPSGQVQTFVPAGSGIRAPLGLAVDKKGNLYVADIGDPTLKNLKGRILKISPSRQISVFVEDVLIFPNALAFDQSENLYVSDSFIGTIFIVNPDGHMHSFVTGLTPPTLENGLSLGPNGIAFNTDGTALFVAETTQGLLRKIAINPDGSAGSMAVVADGLVGADGIALDKRENVYVAINSQNAILRVDPKGNISDVASGFRFPASLVFWDKSLYVTNFDIPTLLTGQVPELPFVVSKVHIGIPGLPLQNQK